MSHKNLDNKNRLRSKIVSFRVSPEEWNRIETAVALSGLTKQDYIIKRLENHKVIVRGTPKVYKSLKSELEKVHCQLMQYDLPSDELLTTIRLIATTVNGFKGDDNESRA